MAEKEDQSVPFLPTGELKKELRRLNWACLVFFPPRVTSQINHSFLGVEEWGIMERPGILPWGSSFTWNCREKGKNMCHPPRTLPSLCLVMTSKITTVVVISFKKIITWVWIRSESKADTTRNKLFGKKEEWIKANASKLPHCPPYARHFAVPRTTHFGSKL